VKLADLVPVKLLLPAIPLVVLAVVPAQPPAEEQVHALDETLEHRMRPSPLVCTPRKRDDLTGCEKHGDHYSCLRVDMICESVSQPHPQIQF
jgi:hypothetical protein